jgi:hypothetical protein
MEQPMKMTINPYLLAHNSASNKPIGSIHPLNPSVFRESGWNSVIEFQKDRMLHFLGHYREFAVPIPNGIKVIERYGTYGFKRIMEIVLSPNP